MKILLFLTFFTSTVWALDVGQIIKTSEDSYIFRKSDKLSLKNGMVLEVGDEVYSGKGNVIVLLYPASQLAIASESSLRLSENNIDNSQKVTVSSTLVELKTGHIRALLTRIKGLESNLRIRTEAVSFTARGTEFDVLIAQNKDVEADVVEGIVEASSPSVQSFVPEIIKGKNGIRFSVAKRNFEKKPFVNRFEKRPDFLSAPELSKLWAVHVEKKAEKPRNQKREGIRTHQPKKKK